MMAQYAREAHGYVTLHPVLRVGRSLKEALLRTRASTVSVSKVMGYGLLIPSLGIQGGVRLNVASVNKARLAAAAAAKTHGKAYLCRAVAMGGKGAPVYEVMDEVVTLSSAQAASQDVLMVAPNGVLVNKALSSNNPRDITRMAEKLAGQLRGLDRKFITPYLERMLKVLDVNWSNLSAADTDKVFTRARKVMNKLRLQEIMPTWSAKVFTTAKGVAKDSRKVVHEYMTARVGLSLNQVDIDALRAQAAQTGWFLRDQFGQRSDALTARGRAIVQQGMRHGLGQNWIAKELQRQLPDMWKKYGASYARVVAGVAVTRARAYSDVSGYRDAGIEYLEVQAILDERTTEICRALDGTIVEVDVVYNQQMRALEIDNPEDIRKVSPFMVERKDPSGQQYIETMNGYRVADVVRSGMGRLDDRGEFKFHRLGRDLTNVGVGVPPYHYNCRSTTVPRTTVISVPRGMVARAAPVMPRPRPTAPYRPTTRQGFAPSTTSRATRRDFQRPPTYVPRTQVTRGRTTIAGQNDPVLMAARLGYPAEMVGVEPTIAYRRAIKTGGSEAAAAKWKLDPKKLDEFEKKARWQLYKGKRPSPNVGGNVPVNVGPNVGGNVDPNVAGDLSQTLQRLRLGGKDLAVTMRISKVTPERLKSVVLHEAEFGASRLYWIRGLDEASSLRMKFDWAKVKMSANALTALRKAKTQDAIRKALKDVEKAGFFKRKRISPK